MLTQMLDIKIELIDCEKKIQELNIVISEQKTKIKILENEKH